MAKRAVGLNEARKGITTKAGMDMAKKNFQRDDKKADLNKDGELSSYEKARGDAVQKAVGNYAHGGMPCDSGMMSDPDGTMVPLGSSAENVADDIDAKLSQGEYVLPAHVVKWHGLKHIMDMQTEAEMGLMGMDMDGLLKNTGEEDEPESDSESPADTEVSSKDNTKQEEKEVIETPQGNEIEVAGVDTIETTMDAEAPDESDEDYYPSKSRDYGMMKIKPISFIR